MCHVSQSMGDVGPQVCGSDLVSGGNLHLLTAVTGRLSLGVTVSVTSNVGDALVDLVPFPSSSLSLPLDNATPALVEQSTLCGTSP